MPPPSLRSGLAATAWCYAPVLRAPSGAPCISASWPRCRGLLPLPAKGVLFCVLSILRCRAPLLVFVLGQLALSRSALRFSPRPQQRWGCRCWVGGGAPPPSLAASPASVGLRPLVAPSHFARASGERCPAPRGGAFFSADALPHSGAVGLTPSPAPLGRGLPLLRARSRFELRHFVFLNKSSLVVPTTSRPDVGAVSLPLRAPSALLYKEKTKCRMPANSL